MNRRNLVIIFVSLIVSIVCLASIVIIIFSVLGKNRVISLAPPYASPSELIFPTSISPTNIISATPLQPIITSTAGVVVQQPTDVTTNLPEPSGKIVFTCQVFKDSRYNQICVMNADGSDYQRLTTEDEYDHIFPSLAPDGSVVVYSSNQTGGYEIYSLDWSGKKFQLTDEQLAGDLGAFAPEISPDGQWVVYYLLNSDSQKSIWIVDRSGNQKRWLFGSESAGAWDPSWSPDGTRILFMSDRTGSSQLHTIAADGSDIQKITELGDLRGRNDWSPDGTTIATYIGKTWEREIILMNVDGTNQRYITDGGNNLAPSFSPDGQWLAITSYIDLFKDVNGCEIYILRVDGTDMRRLTNNDYCDWQPRWGP